MSSKRPLKNPATAGFVRSAPELHKTWKKMVVSINETMRMALVVKDESKIHSLTIPYHTKRARRGSIMISAGDGKDLLDLPKNKLESLVKGIIWSDAHFKANASSFLSKDIKQRPYCTRQLTVRAMQ